MLWGEEISRWFVIVFVRGMRLIMPLEKLYLADGPSQPYFCDMMMKGEAGKC